MYRKRPGTSGVHGHLYESKLLSLILFRAQRDEEIEEFDLASNVAGLGAFDDICFKAKIKGHIEPLIVFIQAKHKENTDKLLNLNSESDLEKYFNSYVAIKEKFNPKSDDKIFNELFDKTECLFVIYTNEGSEHRTVFAHKYANHLNRLIATGETGSQPSINIENIQLLTKSYTAKTLAKRFVKFLYSKNNEILMKDDYISDYHVILAERVVDVSEVQNYRRTCTFRQDFFDSNDVFLVTFRDQLYKDVVNMQKTKKNSVQEACLNEFLSEPSEKNLANVIGNVVANKNGKLKFISNVTKDLQKQLDMIKLPQSTVNNAIEIAAMKILKSSKFSVPVAFGNTDLRIRGDPKNIAKRIKYLTSSIANLIKKSKPSTDIVIHESVSEGLFGFNGGLGSAVGKLLVYDHSDTKFIKFTNNSAILKDHDRKLYENLKNSVYNLHEYRFDISNRKLPKLTIDRVDEGLVQEFLSKLVFFSYQGDQSYVEWILKREIEDHQRRKHKNTYTFNFSITSDAIYLKYHDKVQNWWMSKKASVPYLTKLCDMYDQTAKSIVNNPQISSTNMMSINEVKSIVHNVQFNKKNIEALKFLDTSSVIIVTERTKLTIIKVLQYLEFQEHIVLDLNYIIRLSTVEFCTLIIELNNLNREETVIFICDDIRNDVCYEKIEKLSQAIDKNKNIVVTNKMLVDEVKRYFPQIDKEFIDEKHRLVDLSHELQNNIMKGSLVMFQGEQVSLDMVVDDKSKVFVEGDVLNELIHNNTYEFSESPCNSEYAEIKHLYVDRAVRRGPTEIQLRTLFDIEEDIVVITADAGAGKSILLTHLSLKTIKSDISYFIVRINLSEHSEVFNQWQVHETVIGSLEMLKFMCCEIMMKSKRDSRNMNNLNMSLKHNDGEAYLDHFTGDDRTKVELNIFLCHYHTGHVLFLFDGFDEICPYYSHTVIHLLNVIKNGPSNNKIWVTTRSYNNIEKELVKNFGVLYKLLDFSQNQLLEYLKTFWCSKLGSTKLSDKQLNKIKYLLDKTSAQNVINTATLSRSLGTVKVSFILFLINIYPKDGAKRWNELNSTLMFLINNDSMEDVFGLPERSESPICIPSYRDNDSMEDVVGLPERSNSFIFMPSYREAILEGDILKNVLDVQNDFVEEEPSPVMADNYEVESPLFTYLAANYFVHRLLCTDENIDTQTFDVDISSVYEGFIETIVKKHFEDKYKVGIYNPVARTEFTKTLNQIKGQIKKVAAYVIFKHARDNLFDSEQLEEIHAIIHSIKSGEDKIGVICSVSNNVPHFVHRTFAEYLAVEYLFDVIKSKDDYERKILVEDLSGNIMSLCVWINQKLSQMENRELCTYFHVKEDVVIPFPVLDYA